MRHFQSGIQKQGGNDGLQGIDQQGHLAAATTAFLALAQAEVLSNIQLSRRTQQMARAYQVRPQLGKLPFLIFGKTLEKFPAYYKTEHRVAEEFHLLVINCRSRSSPGRILRFAFPGIGGVREGLLQKCAAGEAMSESVLQRGKVKGVKVHGC